MIKNVERSKQITEFIDKDNLLYYLGSDFLDRFGLSEFLSYFVPFKVIGNKATFKTIPRVLRGFIKWLNEKGWINKEICVAELELIDDFKEDALDQLRD